MKPNKEPSWNTVLEEAGMSWPTFLWVVISRAPGMIWLWFRCRWTASHAFSIEYAMENDKHPAIVKAYCVDDGCGAEVVRARSFCCDTIMDFHIPWSAVEVKREQ